MRKALNFLVVSGAVFVAAAFITLDLVVNRLAEQLVVPAHDVVAAAIVGAVAAVVVGLRAAEPKT